MLCHLITVGTSLQGSSDKTLRELVKERLVDLSWLSNPCPQHTESVVDYLLGLEGDLCVRDRQHDPLCQELSYLHLDYLHRGHGPQWEDRVVLLTSDTDQGRACALITLHYLSKARFAGSGLSHCEVVTLRGLAWGNAAGLGLCLVPKWTHLVKLSSEGYLLSEVPVSLGWDWWLALNAGFVAAIVALLVIPTAVVSTVKPEETIRYE